jgi:hypothetical protein
MRHPVYLPPPLRLDSFAGNQDSASPATRLAGRLTATLARGRKKCIVPLILWTAVAVFATTARAAPRTFVALQYETAPDSSDCPDAGDFQRAVKRQLGYDPFRSAAERHVDVKLAQNDTGFDGWIKWSDAHGRWVGDRRLSSQLRECGEIAANVAFAVAVQIQLLTALAPESPDPSAPSTATATSASATSKSDASTIAPPPPKDTALAPGGESPVPRRARFRLSAGIGPFMALGIAPHVAWGGRLFVSGRINPFSLELSVDGALPASQSQPDGSSFSVDHITAGAAACGHVQAFAGCLTATLGRLHASGSGVDVSLSPSGLLAQVGARLAATHDFSERFFAGARVDGLVMLSPWTVTLNDQNAWTTPRVGAVIGLDFGGHFF